MKRQKRQRIMVSVLAGFLAFLMILPILANIFIQ